MGVDAVSAGQCGAGWSADPGASDALAWSLFLGGDPPALPRAMDRLDPPEHAWWAGPEGQFYLV